MRRSSAIGLHVAAWFVIVTRDVVAAQFLLVARGPIEVVGAGKPTTTRDLLDARTPSDRRERVGQRSVQWIERKRPVPGMAVALRTSPYNHYRSTLPLCPRGPARSQRSTSQRGVRNYSGPGSCVILRLPPCRWQRRPSFTRGRQKDASAASTSGDVWPLTTLYSIVPRSCGFHQCG